MRSDRARRVFCAGAVAGVILGAGCGTTKVSGTARTATEQLPVPISSLFPDAMMALGEISGMLTISGTMTMEVAGSSFTLPFGTEAGAAQPFAVCIYPDGAARLTFPLMSRDGFARDWVEGTLTRQPLP